MAWALETSIKGPKGDQGIQGIQGAKGDQGVKGEDGKGIEIAGSVATYAALPADLTSNDVGKGFLVEADGLLYIWTGTSFPANGSGVEFVGPEGDQGPAGLDGVSVTGATVDGTGKLTLTLSNSTQLGPWNVKGPKGDVGEQGIEGAKGDTGETGQTGSDGIGVTSANVSGGNLTITLSNSSVQGPWNVKGAKGDQGIQGIEGPEGPEGPQGEEGIQGLQGLQGVQGTKGDQGLQGAKGDTGARGTRWFIQTGTPGTLTGQVDGDLYLDSETGNVWRFSAGA